MGDSKQEGEVRPDLRALQSLIEHDPARSITADICDAYGARKAPDARSGRGRGAERGREGVEILRLELDAEARKDLEGFCKVVLLSVVVLPRSVSKTHLGLRDIGGGGNKAQRLQVQRVRRGAGLRLETQQRILNH